MTAGSIQNKQRIRAAHESLVYLLTDPSGVAMVASGLMPEHLQAQAKRALAWLED